MAKIFTTIFQILLLAFLAYLVFLLVKTRSDRVVHMDDDAVIVDDSVVDDSVFVEVPYDVDYNVLYDDSPNWWYWGWPWWYGTGSYTDGGYYRRRDGRHWWDSKRRHRDSPKTTRQVYRGYDGPRGLPGMAGETRMRFGGGRTPAAAGPRGGSMPSGGRSSGGGGGRR
jgi:hypothetical protein